MGSVYRRGHKLWIAFKGYDGKRVLRPSGFSIGDEKRAHKLLGQIEGTIAAQRGNTLAPLTFAAYVEQWGRERKALGLSNAKLDQRRLENHACPTLGRMLLKEVRPKHVYELVTTLRRKRLAPRTVIDTANLVRRLFNDAVAAELVEFSPFQLKRGALPKKTDKDPTWRANARFTREEAELLFSDLRVPAHRRIIWGVLLLTGMRSGELAALRWRHYDAKAEPLGALQVAFSFTRRNKTEKSTKTGQPRVVPVHPTLAALLAQWKLSGFVDVFGKRPEADDLLVPNLRGHHLTDNNLGDGLAADLAALGLAPGRTPHNMRRTFISLARADGAGPALRTVTHDGKGDQFDEYTTFTHADRCAAVCSLKLEIRRGTVLQLAASTQGANSAATRNDTGDDK